MAQIIKCNLQESLRNVFQCDPTVDMTMDKVAFSQFLYDQSNMFNLQSRLLNNNGQKTNVELMWKQPDCSEAIDGCFTDVCIEGPAPIGYKSEIYSIECNNDNSAFARITFNIEDYRTMLAIGDDVTPIGFPTINATNEFGREILRLIYNVDKKMEQKLAASLLGYVDTTTFGFAAIEGLDAGDLAADKGKKVKTHSPIDCATGTIKDLFTEVRKSANAANFCQLPVIIGFDMVADYIKLNQSLCCDYDGYNLATALAGNQIPFLNSVEISRALAAANGTSIYGNPHFLSVNLGEFQVVNYTRFNGLFRLKTDTMWKDKIVSPYTGRDMNIAIRLDECASKVTVVVGATEELIKAPTDKCATSDSFGANGIQQFYIKNEC